MLQLAVTLRRSDIEDRADKNNERGIVTPLFLWYSIMASGKISIYSWHI